MRRPPLAARAETDSTEFTGEGQESRGGSDHSTGTKGESAVQSQWYGVGGTVSAVQSRRYRVSGRVSGTAGVLAEQRVKEWYRG